MNNNDVQYISYEEVLDVYARTIEKSGGGFSGIRDEGGIRAVIEFIQNDAYYPNFTAKLSYLVFRFCSGHFFNDGNKRVALTLGAYLLHKNGQNWAALTFMKRLEAIVYHIAAGNINDELLLSIIQCIVDCTDFSESLKIDIANAMSKGKIGIEENEQVKE
ncbi:MAG: Fic family protein [Bacteroidales bacterium]|nr:Fic family protein [Bacteroidales bacterium]